MAKHKGGHGGDDHGGGGGAHDGAGSGRWMLTYLDMVTLLLGLFIILAAASKTDTAKYNIIANQASKVFGHGQPGLMQGAGNLPNNTGVLPNFKPQKPETGKDGKSAAGKQGDKGPEFKVEETAMGKKITMSSGMIFESGSAVLKDDAKKILSDVYSNFIKGTNNCIVVKGHTDSQPISTMLYPSNWELSSGRAGTVSRFLVDKYSIAPSRVTIAGYADTIPVESNATAEGRAKNRRVEVWLLSSEACSVMRGSANMATTTVGENGVTTTVVPKPSEKITLGGE